MAEQTGKVVETMQDGWARVVTDRKGACGGCHSGADGCRSCLVSARMESRVANPVGARAGDIVRIGLRSADLLRGAAILYLIPVVLLIGGAFAGSGLAGAYSWPQTTAAALAALAGLVLGFSLVVLLDRSRYVRRHFAPTITSVVTVSDGTASGKAPCCH